MCPPDYTQAVVLPVSSAALQDSHAQHLEMPDHLLPHQPLIESNSTSSSSSSSQQGEFAWRLQQRNGEPFVTTTSLSQCSPRNSNPTALPPVGWKFSSSSMQEPQVTVKQRELSSENVSIHTEPSSSASRRNGLIMHIRTQTWTADSHELFDYESRNVLSSEFKCACMRDSYHISRVGTEVHLLSSHEAKSLYACEPHAKVLAQIVWANDGHYYLLPPPNENTTQSVDSERETNVGKEDNGLWLAVRYLRDRSAVVTSGDVLKLGRFQLKVKEVVMTSQDAKDSRFLNPLDDNDDCETVAPDPGDTVAQEISCLNDNTTESCIKNFSNFSPSTCIPSAAGQIKSKKIGNELSKRSCRICLCEAADLEDYNAKLNPLVAPCECKGSLEWVHLQCLRTWISGRLNIRNNSSSFFWKSLQCELCKVTYPTFVRVFNEDEKKSFEVNTTDHHNFLSARTDEEHHELINATTLDNKSLLCSRNLETLRRQSYFVELFEFPRPDVPYVILEPRARQNDKGFHVVSLAHNHVARLGRGHESEVRLADISVSRLHSLLRYQSISTVKRQMNLLPGSSGFGTPTTFNSHGCFLIEDHHSKFGTLLELQQPFRLDTAFPSVSIQAGRTVITISLRRRWRLRIPACILQRQHALSSDIYVLFRQPQQITPSDILLENQRETFSN